MINSNMMAVQKASLAFGLMERTKGPLWVTFDAEIKHTTLPTQCVEHKACNSKTKSKARRKTLRLQGLDLRHIERSLL